MGLEDEFDYLSGLPIKDCRKLLRAAKEARAEDGGSSGSSYNERISRYLEKRIRESENLSDVISTDTRLLIDALQSSEDIIWGIVANGPYIQANDLLDSHKAERVVLKMCLTWHIFPKWNPIDPDLVDWGQIARIMNEICEKKGQA